MLSTAKSFIASSLLAFGYFSQDAVAQCIGESNGVTYDFCGRIDEVNVYWTNLANQTNILFERADDGYTSFGFANQPSPNAMVGANHIFGCDDFGLGGPFDGVILARSVDGVVNGLGTNALSIPGTISINRVNGVCGIRFERLHTLINATEVEGTGLVEAQNIVNGTANTIIWARGNGDAPAIHLARGSGSQDFLANEGILTDNPVQPIVVQECVGQTNGVTYDFCGRTGGLNVYWTNGDNQTTILFESLDNGYTSLGFASNLADSGQLMIGANHILGCDDFGINSPVDGLILNRSLAGVVGGLGQNALAIEGSISQIRMNGICGIEFDRLHTLGPNAVSVDGQGLVENQNIVNGTENVIVWARGPGDAPAQHTARGAASQDFLNNMGDLTDMPVELFEEVPDVDVVPDEGSAATLSVKLSILAASVASAARFL